MTNNEKELVKEGLQLLDDGLEKLAAIEDDMAVNAIVKLVHGAILAAELLMKL